MKIRVLKGVRDILPTEITQWNFLHKQAGKVFSRYGYKQIIVPIIEESGLFTRSIGQQTDIVEKEMYTFLDKGNRSIALRPEATASIVRAYLEHNYSHTGLTKFFYSGPMFRGEKPQAGRNRQFYQIGVEAIGSYNPFLDAETLNLAIEYLKEIGIKNFNVLINTVGSSEDKQNFSRKLKAFLLPEKNLLCENCQSRYERNVLRILDCKSKSCKKMLKNAPKIIDCLSQESLKDFAVFQNALELLKVDYILDPYLVRGLDYYTKTVFEITHDKLGAQNTILAGGRYDNLIEQLGGPTTGAIGFACGVERLLLAQKAESFTANIASKQSIFAIGLGAGSYSRIFKIAHTLRKNSISVHLDFENKSIKAQMRQANKLNCSHVLILGDDELKDDNIIIKYMDKGTQELIKISALLEVIKRELTP
ncbi:MAG: histidine--tRNA ligase [Candidatus Omnitrophica bacterium]|nr:histidine--tRNA ligase [Candidatus Omnitrophota bacterium]